jgi:predicted secreted Zn-dependent protease
MLNSLVLAASAFLSAQDYGGPAAPPVQPQAPTVTRPKTATTGVPAAAPAGRSLQSLPNTTIRYYDVPGKNPQAILKSIAKLRPKGADGQPVTASTNWDIGATFKKRTENGVCRIVAATATFSATADLPRLVSPKALRREALDSWNSYVAGLESIAAANLWFVHDRIGQVEKAILASSCDGAQAAGAAAVDKLKLQEAEFTRANAAAAAAAAAARNQ